jgi:cysteine synthase A
MNVRLQPLQLDEIASVNDVELEERDLNFAGGSLKMVFERLKENTNPHAHLPFLIIVDREVAGFFMLREGPALPPWAPPGAISLHNLRISEKMQGRGYGGAALVLAARWIALNRSRLSQVMLSANVENDGAIRFYRRWGFKDFGLSFEGRLGREATLSCGVAELAAKELPGE